MRKSEVKENRANARLNKKKPKNKAYQWWHVRSSGGKKKRSKAREKKTLFNKATFF